MGQGFGRVVTGQTGLPIQVSADGQPEVPIGGITIDWSTVTAVNTDTTLADGTIVPSGRKYLLYGQVLCKETSGGNAGYYGPYLSTATDGRQTVTRGEVVILNRTQLEVPLFGPGVVNSNHPAVMTGGLAFLDRIQAGGAGQPGIASLLAAMPRLRVVEGTAVVPASNFPATLAVPTTLAGVGSAGHVALTWDAMPSALEYIVLRGTVTGGPYVEVNRALENVYTDAVAAGTYYYVVKAVYADGTSANSAQASGTAT